MAEWLRRGLQSLVLRFKSGWRLQLGWWNGRHERLKISCSIRACGFDPRPEHHSLKFNFLKKSQILKKEAVMKSCEIPKLSMGNRG
jgi:hypothetical protein